MQCYRPAILLCSHFLPSSLRTSAYHTLPAQHRDTPTHACGIIFPWFRLVIWTAPLGTLRKFTVSGLVARASASVLVKTAQAARLLHKIRNQNQGTSRK